MYARTLCLVRPPVARDPADTHRTIGPCQPLAVDSGRTIGFSKTGHGARPYYGCRVKKPLAGKAGVGGQREKGRRYR